MVKYLIFFIFLLSLKAGNLQKDCLDCHIKENIPSGLIYRKYLARYSTQNRMEESIFNYLKNPKKEKSILPTQFFRKFPMKKRIKLKDNILREDIKKYLKKFDLKKKLVLQK